MGATTTAVLGLLSTGVLTLLAVVGAFRSFTKSAREQREKIATEKQAEYMRGLGDRQTEYNKGNADARRDLGARIELLESRIRDVERDRELAQDRAERLESELRSIWSNPRAPRPRADPNDTQGEGP